MILFPILALLCTCAYFGLFKRTQGLPLTVRKTRVAVSEKLSVIIPARDEEANIAQLLSSLNQQTQQPLEIIVVDDQSTDLTRKVALDHGAKVISPGELPAGWKGKPWACHHGALNAQGEWLLFLDADTILDPSFLSRLPLADHTAISVCPYHDINERYEELSVFFNVLTIAGVSAGSGSDRKLFGQSLALSKNDYWAAGGHEIVKNEVLENFHFADHLHRTGVALDLYLGKGSLSMRMFPDSYQELYQGWKKSCVKGAGGAPRRVLIKSSLWITGGMISFLCPFLLFRDNPSFLWAAVCFTPWLFFAATCLHSFQKAGRFSYWAALFFPFSLLFYQFLFFSVILEKKRGIPQTWKNRDVD